MSDPDFAALALGRLDESTRVRRLLVEGKRAVVLERIARGAGATRWYLIGGPRDLEALARRLRPGSCVSFYFDDRFVIGDFGHEVRAALRAVIDRDGEAVLGAVRPDDFEIDVDFPSSMTEAGDFAREHPRGSTFVSGGFPARDNDGVAAVTVVLSDADGVIRPHPY